LQTRSWRGLGIYIYIYALVEKKNLSLQNHGSPYDLSRRCAENQKVNVGSRLLDRVGQVLYILYMAMYMHAELPLSRSTKPNVYVKKAFTSVIIGVINQSIHQTVKPHKERQTGVYTNKAKQALESAIHILEVQSSII
jgi:hypothetical protein